MNRIRCLALTLALLGCLTANSLVAAPATASGLDRKATVRLYSNGKVVAEWEADGPGRMEGSSYVFTIADGTERLEVRISGTFSVEEKR